ncbi:efflux RND transporter periplasmic adaptor subunit [Shewanella xiamenensis]|uniref:Efflux RND transporter periplasmic adaptor subunit n=1 Tax=Shewanella xiamenensis TaxID=332186 RepID=A0AAE4TI65_9GAMM|nr:efflux RND transporter periplasmic adaptor subunit [Shewanella xiamenensis]MDV5393236.1 efflux RND transporter periplasmic adaptor subunit [Shewanella xiamenensis]
MNKAFTRRSITAVVLLSSALSLVGCSDSTPAVPQEAGALPVTTLSVRAEKLVLISDLPGRVEPMRVAQVRARVAGIILQRHFTEGADVAAGDVLFQIDPAPLKAALTRAEGEQAKADAELVNARAKVTRYEPLAKIEAISQQDLDTALAELRTAQAAVSSARASVVSAKLDLSYATVTAPISGRIGRALTTEGALVGQGEATLLTTIQQLNPVYVDFTQPVAKALELQQLLKSGQLADSQDKKLTATIEGTRYEAKGDLLFSDIAVERSTGQITLRGEFDNTENMLLPGMYVRVKAPQAQIADAILIPQRAVQFDASGKSSVWVVDANNTVQQVAVELGIMQGKNWQVTQGLNAGDKVITGGISALTPGSAVVETTAAQ